MTVEPHRRTDTYVCIRKLTNKYVYGIDWKLAYGMVW